MSPAEERRPGPPLNWRRGILRLWFVVTLVYVPCAVAVLWWTTVDVQQAVQDRVYAELESQYPRAEPAPERSFADRVRGFFRDAREGEAEAREMTLDELVEFLERQEEPRLRDHVAAFRTSISEGAWTWLGVVLVPPVFFFGLARGMIWALEGFGRGT